jgi:hypothetical protein
MTMNNLQIKLIAVSMIVCLFCVATGVWSLENEWIQKKLKHLVFISLSVTLITMLWVVVTQ